MRKLQVTTILFVRHTEVENPDGVLYGRLPRFGLSDAGREHAGRIAEAIADRDIVAIYTSPLLRARQTGAAIAAHHADATVHRSSLLIEVGSAWQGSPLRSFASGFSTYQCRRAEDDESLDGIQARMLAFTRRVGRRHAGETVVAVSHGDPITILRVTLQGQELTVPAIRGEGYIPLGSITEVRVEPDGERITLERVWEV